MLEPCPLPALTNDIARDLVNTEEARLCAEADKAGIKAWSESLVPPAKQKGWLVRMLPWRKGKDQ